LFYRVIIMNIEAAKLELMHLLLQTQRESLLNKLKKVFEEEQTDWYNDMNSEEQQEIEIGLKQADNQDFVSHNQVMDNFNKWH